MKTKLTAALAALTMLATLFAPICEAKSFGGGGGRSSGGGGFRSSGSSSSKSSGSWGSSSSSSKPSSAKPSSGSANNKSGYTKPQSKVEYNRYKDAVKGGKAFKTKEAATADFKTKHGSQYSSKFATEPAKRPDYIPSRYRHNGRDVDISFNPGMGYGYWGGGGPGLGTFMLYDAMSDAAMASVLMNRHGYHVGPAPHKPFPVLWAVLITFVVVGGVIYVVYRVA